MVEITQEANPIIEKLKICTVVAVFAPLGKTLLQFGLSSRVTHFFRLIWKDALEQKMRNNLDMTTEHDHTVFWRKTHTKTQRNNKEQRTGRF